MCADNPKLPKEANKAKCVAVACFVFSVFSMIGFAGGTAGIVGALCGLLACIAASILMCCAPKSAKDGGCKFTAVRCPMMSPGIADILAGRRPRPPRLTPDSAAPRRHHICYTNAYHAQAGVLLLIAGIIQLIMGSIVIVQIATLVNAVSLQ